MNKIFESILLILLQIPFAGASADTCEPKSIDDAYLYADVVVLGRISGKFDWEESTVYTFDSQEQFKGTMSTSSSELLITFGEQCENQFSIGQTYLIYGSSLDRDNWIETSLIHRTRVESKALDDLKYLRNLECRVVEKNLQAACNRDIFYVCGCNGITYGNPCGAGSNGIFRWKVGECE